MAFLPFAHLEQIHRTRTTHTETHTQTHLHTSRSTAHAQAQAHTNGVQDTVVHHARNAVAMLEALFPIPEIQGAIFRHTLPYPRKQVVAPLLHRYDVTCCWKRTHTCTCADISAIQHNQPHAHMKMVYLRERARARAITQTCPTYSWCGSSGCSA